MHLVWLVILLPLLGAVVNGLILQNRVSKKISHVIGSAVMVGAAICALIVWSGINGGTEILLGFEWIEAGGFRAPLEVIIDPLSGMMMLVITIIGSLIHVYAGGYMHEEKETWRFFSYLNLFVFMMLLLVLGNNLLVMFVGWEGVGLCSYLLIGYWYSDDNNAAAGMKAFLVNRIGDIGFLIGIFLAYQTFGTITFRGADSLMSAIGDGYGLTDPQLMVIGWITLALFVGACGKSAQIPLYVWLPDAMAGPTPVSALIHAATMVTAGIYMMCRLSYMFYLAPTTMTVVAAVGAATALFAATIAIVQNDIKKVLAYSTVSQLGYMVLACGVGAFGAGAFHLLTHACFKALLFLGAGSVIVAMHHKQDMREMGGLKKYMPKTRLAMLIGVAAISGFPLTSGFFSKDEILWRAWEGGGWVIWGMGAAAAFCTAFYMMRLYLLTFEGENRSDSHTREHLHETGVSMWGVLWALAIPSALIGLIQWPHISWMPHWQFFEHYLAPVLQVPASVAESWAVQKNEAMEVGLMAFSVAVMGLAWFIAFKLYAKGPSAAADAWRNRFPGVYDTLLNKYYVDESYFALFVNPLRDISMFLWRIIDTLVIDGLVNGFAQACTFLGGFLSFKSTGSIGRHAMLLVLGVFCMLTVLAF